jgi:hypothetical protein
MPGGLSPDGGRLVLQSADGSSATPGSSHLLIVDTSFKVAPVKVDLAGLLTFDAISNGGQRLYLIEHIPTGAYWVRMYDVGSAALDPTVIVDKSDGSEAMTGLRLSGISSADGQWLYSMYIREGASPFIHALSLDGPFAFCIDLPGSGYASDANAFRWSIAMRAGGAQLFAANAASGTVSELSVSGDASPSLARSARIGAGETTAGLLAQDVVAKELGANAAVVTPDGRSMITAAASGIVWIDTIGLHASNRLLPGWTVWSLALSPDGKVLWALGDSGKIAEISVASRQISATFDPGAGYPMALMRVEAA